MDFLHDLGVEDLAILNQKDLTYDSAYSATEILSCLADVAENEPQQNLDKSPYVTVLADESTDITNHKRLVIYAQTCDIKTMDPKTHFVTNIECLDATGQGIAYSIIEEFGKRDVTPKRIMSFGSDGAKVMTGTNKGMEKLTIS